MHSYIKRCVSNARTLMLFLALTSCLNLCFSNSRSDIIQPGDSLQPIADAYVVNGTQNENNNYGTRNILIARDKSSFGYKSLLQFDLSSIGQVNSAILRVYGRNLASYTGGPYEVVVGAYKTTDSWAELQITDITAPNNIGGPLDTDTISTQNYYEWDVTQYVSDEADGDDIVTILLQSLSPPINEGGSNIYLRAQFNSKEHDNNRPVLLINGYTLGNVIPEARMNVSSFCGTPGQSFTIDGTHSADADGTLSYYWEINGDSTSTDSVFSTSFQAEGSYIVKLVVTDNLGTKDSTTEQIIISSSEVTLNPTDDAFTFNGNGTSDLNYGTDRELRVREKKTYGNRSYLKFDLSSYRSDSSRVDKAILRLYASQLETDKADSIVIGIYEGKNNLNSGSNAWTEENLTYNNAPDKDTLKELEDTFYEEIPLAWTPIKEVNKYYELEVTSAVVDALHSGGHDFLTLIIRSMNPQDGRVVFHSKEDATSKPELLLKMSDTKTEVEALMDLYNSTNGSVWNTGTKWDTTINPDPCTWDGITCTGGKITHIDLAGRSISGTIPNSIKNLKDLTTFLIYQNDLSGSIPSSITHLTNLTKLWLSYNELEGPIPQGISRTSIKGRLFLEYNKLSGWLPPSLGKLKNLSYLEFGFNEFTGWIPVSIGSIDKIYQIRFFNNQLSGELNPVLFDSLSTKPNLSNINFNSNQLSGEIPAEVGNLSALVNLRFKNNQLEGNIPNSLGNLSNLQILVLSNNKLTGTIPATLANMGSLENIQLANLILSGCIDPSLTNFCDPEFSKDLSGNPQLANIDSFCVDNTNNCSFDYPSLTELCGCYESLPDTASYTLSNSENYISTQTFRAQSTLGLQGKLYEKVTNVQYIDGLGRPEQTIDLQSSPSQADIHTFTYYDPFGRVADQYLPYTDNSNRGNYVSNPIANQLVFYQNFQSGLYQNDTLYARTQFEASPLNREIEQGAPGTTWFPESSSPGNQTSNEHTSTIDYLVNAANEVPYLPLDVQPEFTLGSDSNYPNSYYKAGELMATKLIDENGSTSYEFKDKLGRTILKASQVSPDASATLNLINGTFAATMYTYDSLGNVKYILQPECVSQIVKSPFKLTQDLIDDYTFQYIYDKRQRLIKKLIPGADTLYMVYDRLDRLRATQDGNLRQKNEWLITKYDKLNRPVITGIYWTNNTIYTQNAMTDLLNNSGAKVNEVRLQEDSGNPTIAHFGYSNQTFPKWIQDTFIHSITYYDDYDFDFDGQADYSYQIEALLSDSNKVFLRNKGLVTGVSVKILNPKPGMPAYLNTVTFYDKYGRELQTQSENHLGGTDHVTNYYNFAGELLRSVHRHLPGGGRDSIIMHKCYSYDHRGRLLKIAQQINYEAPVRIVEHSYDELGRLSTKKLHLAETSSNALQEINFSYNIRDWMTDINDVDSLGTDLFGMHLKYNSGFSQLSAPGKFNGNISGIEWKTVKDANIHGYGFTYDSLNRLTQANYAASPSLNNWTEDVGYFSVPTINYDLNGNILKLSRKVHNDVFGTSTTLLDSLAYSYNGNRVSSITDYGNNTLNNGVPEFIDGNTSGTDYLYDENGNVIQDNNKGLNSISYNYLNKPTAIDLGSNQKISWIYSADGTKLKEIIDFGSSSSTTHDYLGGFFYKNGSLLHFQHEEGRLLNTDSGYRYEYCLKDHLGNVRVTFSDKNGNQTLEPNLEVIQVDHYYPFGLQMAIGQYEIAGTENRYRYNGKELHNELNLGWYDYGARMYDPSIARWNGVDALTETYTRSTPYNYVQNNPIARIDPDGNSCIGCGPNGESVTPPEIFGMKCICANASGSSPDDWVKRDGQIVWDENITDPSQVGKGEEYIGPEVFAHLEGTNQYAYGNNQGEWSAPFSSLDPVEITAKGKPGPVNLGNPKDLAAFISMKNSLAPGLEASAIMLEVTANAMLFHSAFSGIAPINGAFHTSRNAILYGGKTFQAARTSSVLSRASQSAFNAADDVGSIFIKNKHLNIGSGKFAKFNTSDVGTARGIVQDALRSPNAQFLPNPNLSNTFRVHTNLGRTVGTKGQTSVRVIVGFDGKVINAFPIK